MRQSKLEEITVWRKQNPTGTKAQCIKACNVTRPTVDKFWDICGEGNKVDKPYERIQAWRLKNPDGIKAHCIKELRLSKKTVYKYWDLVLQIKEEKNSGQMFFNF